MAILLQVISIQDGGISALLATLAMAAHPGKILDWKTRVVTLLK